MITETLLAVATGLVTWFVSLIPDFGLSLDLDISGDLQQLGSLAFTLDGWFPVTVLVVCLVIVFGVQAAMTVWGFIVWLYHQFWGSS